VASPSRCLYCSVWSPPQLRSTTVCQASHARGPRGSCGRCRAQRALSDASPGCATAHAPVVHAEGATTRVVTVHGPPPCRGEMVALSMRCSWVVVLLGSMRVRSACCAQSSWLASTWTCMAVLRFWAHGAGSLAPLVPGTENQRILVVPSLADAADCPRSTSCWCRHGRQGRVRPHSGPLSRRAYTLWPQCALFLCTLWPVLPPYKLRSVTRWLQEGKYFRASRKATWLCNSNR